MAEARGARTRFVALLRGVNVGRANRIAMADFRRLLEAHGASDVRTLLNSGNAVFDAALAGAAARSAFATTVRDALATELDVRSHVVLLPGADVRRLLAECSFTAEAAHDASRLLVALPYVRGALARLQPLCARSWQDEALAVGRHAAYLWCPHGVIASVLAPAVSAALDDAVTMRNWATATKVAALL